MTPAAKFSINTSETAINCLTSAKPSGVEILSEAYSLDWLYAWNAGPLVEGSGRRALPILITSAPMVARKRVAVGPAMIQLKSNTLMPCSGRSLMV